MSNTIERWAVRAYTEGKIDVGLLETISAASLVVPLGDENGMKTDREAKPKKGPRNWGGTLVEVVLCVVMVAIPVLWHISAWLGMMDDGHDSIAGALAVQIVLLICTALFLVGAAYTAGWAE